MSEFPEAADGVEALQLDPFGAFPHWVSRIAGLGGAEPSPDPAYVFATGDGRPAIGQVKAVVRFHDLAMTHGTLLFEIRVRSAVPGAEQIRLETITVDAATLVAAGGIAELGFESYRNTYYAVACDINDETDITASAISVWFDRQAAPDEQSRHWEWEAGRKARRRPGIEPALIGRVLTDLELPRLETPQSQVGTPQQCREPAFADAMRTLNRAPVGSFDNWSLAYVLRAIARFSGEGPQRMLGFGESQAPLLSHFASRGCEVVGTRHAIDQMALDPGRELHDLRVPELCGEADFFAHVHLSVGNIIQSMPALHDQFDVVWSIGANRVMTPAEYVYFVVNGFNHAKPGGLAVHVFDYLQDFEAERGNSLTRHDIERIAALSISHLNDVARLQFVHGIAAPLGDGLLPFGLVMLRGGWQNG